MTRKRVLASALVGVAALWSGGGNARGAGETSAAPTELEQLAKDVARFQEAVNGYRATARNIVRRELADKQRVIRTRYEPAIAANEKEEKQRRTDAIALFEEFLRKHPDDKRYTPDAMFRLGELYYEKAADDNLVATEAFQKALESGSPPEGAPAGPDFSRTIDLYKRLLADFPTYRMLDRAYYILGYCLTEMGKLAEAKQSFLAMACANRYKGAEVLAAAAPQSTEAAKAAALASAPVPTSAVGADVYAGCEPLDKESKFLAESWTRIGEIHFDAVPGELGPAVSAFNRVLEFKDSGYYDRGLYKLAWSYYRDSKYKEAISYFDQLVKWSDARKASGEKAESDLRPESILYLGISFAEEDWDGDQIPDAETGLQRAEAFYRGRETEAHVSEVYKILGDIYFDRAKYQDAIAVYKAQLSRWPWAAEAPRVQEQVVRAWERERNMEKAASERANLGNYAKGGEWYKRNRDNPEALAIAQELAENALVSSATTVHAQAIACRQQWLANPQDTKKLAECKTLYATAAPLYEKYLVAYPNSKNSYEYGWHYAEALSYSDQHAKAIVAYTAVRDSILDNRYRQDAALQTIKAYEALIARDKAEGRLQEPPIPDDKNTKPPVLSIPVPDIYKRYQETLDWFAENIGGDRAPDMKYETAIIELRYRNWDTARERLKKVTDLYCESKPEVGSKAYDALLKTYIIDYGVTDEEKKDCALGRLLVVTEEFGESACGKAPQAAAFLAKVNEIKTSVKSTVAEKRIKIAMENEEKGTNLEIQQCRDGVGGIAIVTGKMSAIEAAKVAQAGKGSAGSATSAAPAAKISYEFDESLALDLMDMVKANPKDPDSPANLNNACVIYEKLYKPGEATRCFERIYNEYPASPLAAEALWSASRNHFKFFEFEEAARGFLTIAENPKFAKDEHRKEALGQAATLMDNDQQYAKAADLYRRYAEVNLEKPADSAQSYSFSCRALEKLGDKRKQGQCLSDLIKKYGNQPAAGDTVIESYMKKAVIAESSGDRKATFAAYQKVRDEFVSRRLAAATPAAGFAAKADYLLLEEKFKTFQGRRLVFSNPKKVQAVYDGFVSEAKTLADDFRRVWDYKDATWTLAAMLRMGDIYYDFSQKLVKAADDPPEDVKKLEKQNCRANPDDCGMVLQTYKDQVFQLVTPMEDKAKELWKATLERATQLGVTNDYVKKARENLSKYLPDQFPFIKDERVGIELPL